MLFFNCILVIFLILGWGLLYFINFYLGFFLHLLSSLILFFFNMYFLMKQSVDHQILILNICTGSFLSISSLFLLIYYGIAIGTSQAEAFFIVLIMVLGFGLIGRTVISYKRALKKEPQDLTGGISHISSKKLIFLIFITVGIMIIGFSVFIIAPRYSILYTMGILIAVICMLPLTFFTRWFMQDRSFQKNKKDFKNNKMILIGEIVAFLIFLIALTTYWGNFNIPSSFKSPLIVIACVAFEILIILRNSSHYL